MMEGKRERRPLVARTWRRLERIGEEEPEVRVLMIFFRSASERVGFSAMQGSVPCAALNSGGAWASCRFDRETRSFWPIQRPGADQGRLAVPKSLTLPARSQVR